MPKGHACACPSHTTMSMIRTRLAGPLLALVATLAILTGSLMAAGAAPAGAQTTHTVQAGETIGLIAGRYGVTVDAIARANGMDPAELLYVGQRLVIPDERAARATTTAATATTHVVKAGETLRGIAFSYGLTLEALMTANGITDPNLIREGQVLRISGAPGNSSSPAAPSSTQAPAAPASGATAVPTTRPSTPTPAPTATPITGLREHTVASGETLFSIAARYGTTAAAIANTNGITDLSLVRIGQVLRIPPPGASSSAATTVMRTTTHEVARGETLSGIAARYDTTPQVIRDLNGLTGDVVRIGEQLRVPAAAATPTPRPAPTAAPTARPAPTATPRPAATAVAVPKTGTTPAASTPVATSVPTTPTPTRTPLPRVPDGEWASYKVTYYCLPGRMANGEIVHHGAAAADASMHRFGTRIEVEGLGVFTIKDRFAVDLGDRRIDIWTDSCPNAIQWGLRYRNARVVP